MLRPDYLLAAAALAAALAMGTAQAAHAAKGASVVPASNPSTSSGAAYDAAISELRSMHQSCAAMGGTMVYDDGHLVEVSFTDDGNPDYVLLAERAYCDGAASLFCGTGGCAVTAFATVDGGVVTGPFTLHEPQPMATSLVHACRDGGHGSLVFTNGVFQLTGC